jgi:hypothetical protein
MGDVTEERFRTEPPVAAIVALYCREYPERPEVRRFLDAGDAYREAVK